MGVYESGQKIGYTHQRLSADAAGYVFSEESLLRLKIMGAPQTVRLRVQGHTGRDYALRDVDFSLSSGVGNLEAQGTVEGTTLHLTLHTGKDTSQQVVHLRQPLYLPSLMPAALARHALRRGAILEEDVFDPATLQNERIRMTVGRLEPVPHAVPRIQAWRVREEFHGVQTTAWINEHGVVLREEGPMGLVLVRETGAQALHQGWSTATTLDLVTTAAVPVARIIANPRHCRLLRLRLSGIDLNTVPSDAEQVRHGSELVVSMPSVASLQSYTLPYRGSDHQAELAPTAFLQSDHPRIRAAAYKALGNERDARRAAVRLNDWVYAYLRKVPTVSIPNALQVLDMGQGDCNEHAALFAALGRAVGLPTRLVAGVVYLDGAFYYHAWCEVWLGRWVSIDPALHQFPADATHIKFAIGGPEEQMAMLGVIGRLRIQVLAAGAQQPLGD